MPVQPAMHSLYRIAVVLHVCLLVSYGWLWGQQYFARHSPERADLLIFYTAGSIVNAGAGAALYDVSTQTAHQQRWAPGRRFESGVLPFNYPPHVALFGAALAHLPLRCGYAVWAVLQVGLLLGALMLLKPVWGRWAHRERVLGVLVMVTFWPALWSVTLGNVSIAIMAAVVLAWRLQRGARPGSSGVCLALAASKPQLLAPLVWGQCVARRWAVVLGGVLCGLTLLVVSLCVIGGSGVWSYLDMVQLVAGRTSGFSIHPEKMINLRGLAWVLTGHATLTKCITVGAFLLVMALVWRVWRRAGSTPEPAPDALWGLTLAATLLACPHLYPHDLTLLLPAGVFLYDGLRECVLRRWMAAVPVIAFNPLWIGVESTAAAPLVGCGALLAMVVVFSILLRRAPMVANNQSRARSRTCTP